MTKKRQMSVLIDCRGMIVDDRIQADPSPSPRVQLIEQDDHVRISKIARPISIFYIYLSFNKHICIYTISN